MVKAAVKTIVNLGFVKDKRVVVGADFMSQSSSPVFPVLRVQNYNAVGWVVCP